MSVDRGDDARWLMVSWSRDEGFQNNPWHFRHFVLYVAQMVRNYENVTEKPKKYSKPPKGYGIYPPNCGLSMYAYAYS